MVERKRVVSGRTKWLSCHIKTIAGFGSIKQGERDEEKYLGGINQADNFAHAN